MCSIVGFYKLQRKPAKRHFVKDGLDLMRHRGPDAEKFGHYDNRVGLGNQRLSIIDVSVKTNQPMETKKSVLVFNGEIYNYIELRKELEQKGVKINSDSDTEVLLKGVELEGERFFHKLNGMFAFAYYDRAKKQIWLVRDRFGVKPLYYTHQDDVAYFASEIKPLANVVKKPIRNFAIYKHFIAETATDFDSQTFIKDIFQIPPGHYGIVNQSGIKVKKWYQGKDFNFDQKVFQDKVQTRKFAEDLLTDAIAKRLRADVPVSMTLSGGLDSTLIYILIKERIKRPVTVFTVVNKDTEINEIAKVKRLAGEYGDKLIKIESKIKKDAVADIEESLRYLEFSSWDPSVVAYLNIYKAISQREFKVVVEGHGSDEQLGGYPYLVQAAAHELLRNKKWISGLGLVRVYQKMSALGDYKDRPFYSIFRHALVTARESGVNFDKLLATSFEYKILPIVLRTFDRLTMRSAVESRAPFMDYRVVEFFKKMPLDYKVAPIGSKAILREIIKQYGKDYIYQDKRKIGFGVDIVKLMNYPANRRFFAKWVSKFNLNDHEDLKKEALESLAQPKISESGVIPIWKAASLAYIDRVYGFDND